MYGRRFFVAGHWAALCPRSRVSACAELAMWHLYEFSVEGKVNLLGGGTVCVSRLACWWTSRRPFCKAVGKRVSFPLALVWWPVPMAGMSVRRKGLRVRLFERDGGGRARSEVSRDDRLRRSRTGVGVRGLDRSELVVGQSSR